jgi:NAD(P)-dependent dehydrogenase (short-subunit alcohol dehydrogenase family)
MGRVVVTGAANGIGRAIALRILKDGAEVHALDDDSAGLQSLAQSAAQDSACTGQLIGHPVNLASRSDTDRVAATLLDALEGGCDTLVNNAGISCVAPFAAIDDALLDGVFAVNFMAGFRLTRSLLPALRVSGHSSIVNIASELALIGQQGYAAYSATKGAVLAWSRTLAVELAPAGIRVNAICPGPIQTGLLATDFTATGNAEAARRSEIAAVPLGRLGLPADIAEVAVFLASQSAAFVTGAVWPVDGGKTAA